MINLGFYIPSLGDADMLNRCINEIERGFNNKLISDASIFYDNPGSVSRPLPCGLFNATEIWHFKGKLMAITTECAIKTLNIINNIDIYYGYGWGNRNVFATLNILNNKNIKVICRNSEISNDLYRISGANSLGHSENLEGIIEMMMV
jgi:hypothetical protein